MSPSPIPRDIPPPPQPHEPEACWRVWLARRQPARAAVAVSASLIAAGCAFLLFGHPLFALAAGLLIVASASEFLFPVEYRLTAKGAEARNLFGWRRIAWKDVRRVYHFPAEEPSARPDEIKLSPLKYGGPREAFRGVLLRCEGNQQAVLEAIANYRKEAREADSNS